MARGRRLAPQAGRGQGHRAVPEPCDDLVRQSSPHMDHTDFGFQMPSRASRGRASSLGSASPANFATTSTLP
eukprot:15441904-Alexandrium_andersonii.AAC.1